MVDLTADDRNVAVPGWFTGGPVTVETGHLVVGGRVVASPVPEIVIILDCCFAGAAGGVPQLGTDVASLRNGLTILAASRGDQTSAETADGRGLFSTYLCGALEGGAADILGRVTVAGLYSYLDKSFCRLFSVTSPTNQPNAMSTALDIPAAVPGDRL